MSILSSANAVLDQPETNIIPKGSPPMKIDLTKEEYRNLIDMLYIADWVITSQQSETDPELDRYQQLRNKLYALAEKAGLGNLIEFDSELKNYYETAEFEDESACHQIIDEYDNGTFWDRLIEELTMRDLNGEFSGKKSKEKDADAYFARYSDIEAKYMKEFEKNGLKNITIKSGKTARTD